MEKIGENSASWCDSFYERLAVMSYVFEGVGGEVTQ